MSDREWLEQTAKFFTVDDPEYLTCRTVADAVRQYADLERAANHGGPTWGMKNVCVDCYAMHEWTSERKDEWARWLVEMMQDRFNDDDDLAGEDGLCLPDDEAGRLNNFALGFVNQFARMADPQTCKFIGKIWLSEDEVRAFVEGNP